MKRKLLLIGGGGHCKSVLDSLYELNEYDSIGIIDKKENIGKYILSTPIIGSDTDLHTLLNQGYKEAFITLGSIGDSSLRVKLTHLVEDIGFKLPNIIDPSAIVSNYSNLAEGIFVGKRTILNAGVNIGKATILNTNSTVEHDSNIGAYVHISPGAVVCGGVTVSANSHIGASSVIKQGISIGKNTTIGMGSVVLEDIDSNVIAFGNPCKGVQQK
ncbi:serine acetyltransferase [Halobacillus litoralis]|uniref:Serine acetyltransferase n=1 Tax=Halobacillus litoralis TaxID=45668 RepID=A0A845F7K8_9BACI|nr:acetyltransferase [Halobacillus litoralis]MYL69831.1 serine acetyltransferase [Halobacillus litoralis]